MSAIDQQFVEFIAKSLVSNPDAVQIERRIDEKGVLLELTVAPEDLGRVIGKHGATAQSLRTLLRALGTKNDARYNLKIIDTDMPEGGRQAIRDDQAATPLAPVAQDDTSAATTSSDDNYTPSEDNTSEESVEEPRPSASEETSSHSSVVDRTRKELAELDDLDV